MITRRQGREWALQALVQFDLNPPEDASRALEAFWDQLFSLECESIEGGESSAGVVFGVTQGHDRAALARMRAFAEARVNGVWLNRAALDEKIEPFLENWRFYRLGAVERAALRLGAWEMLNCPDIPVPIVINEAVDLVKFFSETKSGRFVNGVLDKFAKTVRAQAAQS